MRHFRYMWIVSGVMLVTGVALAAGGTLLGFGPIALMCGVLLAWSGVVKVVVLRIWQTTMAMRPTEESTRSLARPAPPRSR